MKYLIPLISICSFLLSCSPKEKSRRLVFEHLDVITDSSELNQIILSSHLRDTCKLTFNYSYKDGEDLGYIIKEDNIGPYIAYLYYKTQQKSIIIDSVPLSYCHDFSYIGGGIFRNYKSTVGSSDYYMVKNDSVFLIRNIDEGCDLKMANHFVILNCDDGQRKLPTQLFMILPSEEK